MKLHASIALGAARTMLREARGAAEQRVQSLVRANRILTPVKDESSAKKFIPDINMLFGNQMILKRAEYAKKHSSGIAVGLDATDGDTEGAVDLWGIYILSSGGKISAYKFGLRVQHHALQRFQQREAGVVLDFVRVTEEMAPAIMSVFLLNLEAPENRAATKLLPTLSGAMLVEWDESVEAYAGKTWVRNMDLFPNQRQDRRQMVISMGEMLHSCSTTGVRGGTYAGRYDRVDIHYPKSLDTLIKTVEAGQQVAPETPGGGKARAAVSR